MKIRAFLSMGDSPHEHSVTSRRECTLLARQLKVMLHHQIYQLAERYLPTPSKQVLRFARIAPQMRYLSGPKVPRIGFDVFFPIDAAACRSLIEEITD